MRDSGTHDPNPPTTETIHGWSSEEEGVRPSVPSLRWKPDFGTVGVIRSPSWNYALAAYDSWKGRVCHPQRFLRESFG